MNQPLSRRRHGWTDYTCVPTILAAPALAGFAGNAAAVRVTRVAAANIVLSSLLTRAEWGLFKVMPLKAHLALDVANGAFVAASPWLFGFADDARARNTCLAAGLVGLLAGTLTRPEEMPAGRGPDQSIDKSSDH